MITEFMQLFEQCFGLLPFVERDMRQGPNGFRAAVRPGDCIGSSVSMASRNMPAW